MFARTAALRSQTAAGSARSSLPIVRTRAGVGAPRRPLLQAHVRFSSSSANPSSSASRTTTQRLTIGAALAASLLYAYHTFSSDRTLLSESVASPVPGDNGVSPTVMDDVQQKQLQERSRTQGVYAWGSNRYQVVAATAPNLQVVKTPRFIPYFDGVSLRDLALHEKHGAAVDANGDVYQWGLGFFDPSVRSVDPTSYTAARRDDGSSAVPPPSKLSEATRRKLVPMKTLVGKDIVELVATDEKVFARSRDGKIYVFSASRSRQTGSDLPASSPSNGRSWWDFGGTTPQIDYVVLDVAPSAQPLSRGETFTSMVAGQNHLLALTTSGRTFALPVNDGANMYGQLGVKRVLLNAPVKDSGGAVNKVEAVLEPKPIDTSQYEEKWPPKLPDWAIPPVNMRPDAPPPPSIGPERPSKPLPREGEEYSRTEPRALVTPVTEPSNSIRYATTLMELPPLKGVDIAQITAGNQHSVALTRNGKPLAWGRHTHGQLGLGSLSGVEYVPVPSEVVLTKAFPNSSELRCTKVAAGADNTYFITYRREPTQLGVEKRGPLVPGLSKVDVMAAGTGQWGGLGNAMYSQVQASPVRVKSISGLLEYSEQDKTVKPIPIYQLHVGPPGHAVATLDTERANLQVFGRDLMVWGNNSDYQLGTGKRVNQAVPQHLPPLLPPKLSITAANVGVSPAQVAETALQSQEPGAETTTNGGEDAGEAALAVEPLPRAPDPRTPSTDPVAAAAAPISSAAAERVKSGSSTHTPHNRLQLASRTRQETFLPPASDVEDGEEGQSGGAKGNGNPGRAAAKRKTVRREIEETAQAGEGCTAVFWKVLD